jgi:hypothetical protein
VDEHGDLLGHRVVAEQVGALVGEVLVNVLVLDALQPERPLHPEDHRARPHSEHLHTLLGHCWRLELWLCSSAAGAATAIDEEKVTIAF